VTSLNALISDLDLVLSQNIDDDAVRCSIIAKRLRRFLRPDLLPPETKIGANDRYQRYLIYEDPAGRFCVGSFVWKPGQETPIHDHACWGAFGVVRGCLSSDNFILDAQGELHQVSTDTVLAGRTAWLSPAYGDIHRVANRAKKTSALSLHVYGAPFAEICRTRYDGVSSAVSTPFSSPAAVSAQDASAVG
jgi:predicted metal-dependent enzyme (double-stranded beta helix superfamily)